MNKLMTYPDVEHLIPEQTWDLFCYEPLPCFDVTIRAFLAALSQRLQHEFRAYPELAAFGFWLRPRQIEQQALRLSQRSPVGMVFHLVPSNVPTVAFYSWVMALLMGNPSVIRLSSRKHPTQEAMLVLLREMLQQPDWQKIASRTRFIRYEHNDQITAWFSQQCHLRIVWGGDSTINEIRKIGLSTKAQELVFPDRRSIAIIDSQWLASLSEEKRTEIVKDFQLDCTLFDQKACSSPTTLLWLSEPDLSVKKRFLEQVFAPFADIPSFTMDRLVQSQLNTLHHPSEQISNYPGVSVLKYDTPSFLAYTAPGLVFESVIVDWQEVKNKFWDVQTCVYLGDSLCECKQNLQGMHGRIDRLVKPGQALTFDWYWDGIDILYACSRNNLFNNKL